MWRLPSNAHVHGYLTRSRSILSRPSSASRESREPRAIRRVHCGCSGEAMPTEDESNSETGCRDTPVNEDRPPPLHYASEQGQSSQTNSRLVRILAVFLLAGTLVLLLLLTSWPADRELSPLMRCSAVLLAIGQAASFYQEEHGVFPPDLETLVLNGDLPAEHRCCPYWDLPRGTGYYWVEGVTRGDPPSWILAYDTNHEDGYLILCVSGEVETYRDLRWFKNRLAQFREAYLAARGEYPRVVPPDGSRVIEGCCP
jgi:hypothetical protein